MSVCFERQIININKKVIFWKKKNTPNVKGKSLKMTRKFHEICIIFVIFFDSRLRTELHKASIYEVFWSFLVFSKFTSNLESQKNHIFTAFQNFLSIPLWKPELQKYVFVIFYGDAHVDLDRMIKTYHNIIVCLVNGEKTASDLSHRNLLFCFNTELSYCTRRTE